MSDILVNRRSSQIRKNNSVYKSVKGEATSFVLSGNRKKRGLFESRLGWMFQQWNYRIDKEVITNGLRPIFSGYIEYLLTSAA
jgi:hypothetical protein